MVRSLACLFVAALMAPQCVFGQEGSEVEDAAVLSAIVQSFCAGLVAKGEARFLVLSDQSLAVEHDYGKDPIGHEALASLNSRNAISQTLPKLALCPSVHLTSEEEIRAALRRYGGDDYITGFRQVFPGSFGPTNVSLPGYAEGGTVAVVVVEKAGGSFYYVLRKREGKWSVERTVFRSIA
jgi:hypothetical protein